MFEHSFSSHERKDKVNSPSGTQVKSSKLKKATTNLHTQKFIPVFPACIFSLIQVLHEISLHCTSLLNSIHRRRFILELIATVRKRAKRETSQRKYLDKSDLLRANHTFTIG